MATAGSCWLARAGSAAVQNFAVTLNTKDAKEMEQFFHHTAEAAKKNEQRT